MVHVLISAFGMNAMYFVASPLVQELLGERAFQSEGLAERREAVIDLLFQGLLPRPVPSGPGAQEAAATPADPQARA